MKVLITGAAGYIGSLCTQVLLNKAYDVVALDNLSKGKMELVDKRAKFYKIDLVDKLELEKIFKENKIKAVIHFAAYKAVEESMENAVKYSDNIVGTLNLLNCMVKYKVNKIIFSSSAAVYGLPEKEENIEEFFPVQPINYYGFSKLACEEQIKWYNNIHKINYIILRYFNVAGDGGMNYIDPEAKNIFPIIMEFLTGKREKLIVFGNDYSTKDGTCVRDYIHISDLVEAHILALEKNYCGILNLGTAKGFSVKELINEFSKKVKLSFEFGEKRKGDAAYLVASNKLAKEILNWHPNKNLSDMIDSTLSNYKL